MPQKNNTSNGPRGCRNVLIVRFSAIGDVAMTVPVIYSVARNCPDRRFILVTRSSMTSIFLNRPDNLEVVGVDLKNDYKGLKGVGRLFNELRKKYEIDALVDLHDVLRTKYMRLLARLHRMPVAAIRKDRRGKRALTRKRDKVMMPLTSSRQRYRDTFARLHFPVTETFNGLFPDRKAPASAYAAITAPRADGLHWIGIAPFAKHRGKIYPVEMMEQVVASLSKIEGMRIFLFGGGETEKAILGDWAEKYQGVRSLAGERHGFGVELALLSNLDAMISMDSANMHLASLVNIPVISLWGATHPYCGFKGWRQSDDNIIQLPLTCRPCSVFGDRPCHRGDYLCLAGIRPAVITDKILSVLGLTRENIGSRE